MKFTEAQLGRVFILRLEHGDVIPQAIEDFAASQNIQAAAVHFIGGADCGSSVVVGPEDGRALKPQKVVSHLTGVNEAFGLGTLFRNEQGVPRLHLHSSFGRGAETLTGCCCQGIKLWHIGEVILYELLTTSAQRQTDPVTEFELLEII